MSIDALDPGSAAARSVSNKPSLRARVLRHVLMPLVITWGIGTVIALGTANLFTQRAYDRSLLDDAYLVAAHVSVHEGQAQLDLSQEEVSGLLFDQSEQVYFAVLTPLQQLIAGHPGLVPPDEARKSSLEFYNQNFQGRDVRVVMLSRPQPVPVLVMVAQTTGSRSQLLRQLLLYSLAPQAGLLVWLAWRVRRVIQADFAPLQSLQQAIDQRDADDLQPLSAALVQDASSRDLARLGVAINGLLARIAQGLQAQREFSGNVAHELRTPLAGIRAQAEYGLAHAEPGIWREQLQGIQRSQARATRLVDQLLALALADEGQGGLAQQPLALNQVVREAVLSLLPRADAVHADLGAQGLDEPVWVMGNPALIEGLLGNLVDNALRHGQAQAGEDSVVTVALTTHGDVCELSVTDNGPGLPAHDVDRLTQRWARGGAMPAVGEGAGLGLSIVQRYVVLLGARLSLRPTPDSPSGLQACVHFPTVSAPKKDGTEARGQGAVRTV